MNITQEPQTGKALKAVQWHSSNLPEGRKLREVADLASSVAAKYGSEIIVRDVETEYIVGPSKHHIKITFELEDNGA